VGHRDLGKLLTYQGAFDEAEMELGISGRQSQQIDNKQGLCVNESHSALRGLMMGDAKAALDAARRAWELAMQHAREQFPIERDFVRAGWLIGAALTALALDEDAQRGSILDEAEHHLAEALTRCRRINVVETEPEILLSRARWNRARGDNKEAVEHAQEALAIANRCEYRLNQADIHIFLARLALEAGDRQAAIHHAEIAQERAWCDGPPHSYRPDSEEADRRLLQAETLPR
jgi:tetratricopeptide (TPR) repeat protein